MRTTGLALAVFCTLAVSVTGCSKRELAPLSPCVTSNESHSIQPSGVDAVDLLFMVDNSPSMVQEQAALATEFPRLMQILSEGNSCASDPTGCDSSLPDFSPVSLHVGVITSDIGMGVERLATTWSGNGCDLLGQDGIMQDRIAPEYVDGMANPDPADYNPPDVPACDGVTITPNFLKFDPDAPSSPDNNVASAAELQSTFSCLTHTGASGCFTEQQLESTLQALTPSDDTTIDFIQNEKGQGDPAGANTGFLREDSLLAIIEVTDEDDCSWQDPDMWNVLGIDAATPYPGGFDARCSLKRNEGALFPLDRYVDRLLALRSSPNRLVFAVIAGIPADFTNSRDFDGMLAADDMQILVQYPGSGTEQAPDVGPVDPTTLPDSDPDGDVPPNLAYQPENFDDINEFPKVRPSCLRDTGETDTMGNPVFAKAYPPRRLVNVAKDLDAAGAEALVTSICKHDPSSPDPNSVDFSDALKDILTSIANQITGKCLDRPLNPDPATGEVPCKVIELLGADATCAAALGRFPATPPTDENGRVRCEVAQVPVPSGTTLPTGCKGNPDLDCGWFYDTSFNVDSCTTDTKQRITFLPGAEPSGDVKLECLQAVQGSEDEVVTGSPCEDCPGMDCNCETVGMECNTATNTCMLRCDGVDSVCANNGLRGYVCDPGTRASQADGGAVGDIPTKDYCVNPTCLSK